MIESLPPTYLPTCFVCGWRGYPIKDWAKAEDIVTDHTRKSHPSVMEVIEEMKILEEIAEIAFGFAEDPKFLHQDENEEYCEDCGWFYKEDGHKIDLTIARLLALKKELEAKREEQ